MGLFREKGVVILDKEAKIAELTKNLNLSTSGFIEGPSKFKNEYFKGPSEIRIAVSANLQKKRLENLGFGKGERKLPVFEPLPVSYNTKIVNTISLKYDGSLKESELRKAVAVKLEKLIRADFPNLDPLYVSTDEDADVRRLGTSSINVLRPKKGFTNIDIYTTHEDVGQKAERHELIIEITCEEGKQDKELINTLSKFRSYLIRLDLTELNVLMTLTRD